VNVYKTTVNVNLTIVKVFLSRQFFGMWLCFGMKYSIAVMIGCTCQHFCM